MEERSKVTKRNLRERRSFAVSALQFAIRAYQAFLSPLIFSSCRYYPTCSRYAYVAIELHGPVHGISLAIRRLLRCHPFASAGFDPVPPLKTAVSESTVGLLTANQE